MKNKRVFALLAGMVLVLSAAACGNNRTAGPAENSTVKKESTAAESNASQETNTAPDSGAPAESSIASTGAESEGSSASAGEAADESSEFSPEDSQMSDDGSVINFPQAGISFTLPDSFKNTKGFLPNGGGEISAGDGVFCMYYNYIALSEDDYNNLLAAYKGDPDNPDKYESFFNPRVLGMFSVYAADKNRSAEEIGKYLKKLNEDRGTPLTVENPMEGAELIGTAGEYNFYFLDETRPDAEIAEEDSFFSQMFDLSGYKEEYAALVEDVKNNCADLMEFSEPRRTEE